MSIAEYNTLSERIKRLCDAVCRLEPAAAMLGNIADASASNWHRSLFQHLRPRVEGQPYLLAAVVGGTNTGKSMIFNQLAGATASRVSHIACRTSHPVCLAPRDFWKNHEPQQVFPGFQLRPWHSQDDAVSDSREGLLFIRENPDSKQPPNLLLLDTPDIDGCMKEHWDRAQLVRQAADVLIGVLTAQKYNDEVVRRFFCEAVEADKPVIVVFNMVDWPAKRGACADWLREFRAKTGVEPLHVYAVPHDEEAGMNLQLPFIPLSDGATDLRQDLSDLQFGAIKLRAFRGALRQVLDQERGLPAYLEAVARQSGEYAKAASVIERTTCTPIEMPAVPAHVIMDELWRWLEPRRTKFDVWIHRVWSYPGRVILQRFRRKPEELETEYHEKERDVLVRGLERVFATLEDIQGVGNEIVKRELDQLLGGAPREQIYAEVKRQYQALPLINESYRQFIRAEMDRYAQANGRMLRGMQTFLIATAVIRPVISVAMLGGPAVVHEVANHAASQAIIEGGRVAAEQAALEATRHGATQAGVLAAQHAAMQAAQEAAVQASAHTATQVVGEVAVGAACGVGGDMVVGGGAAASLRALMTRLFTGFYEQRARVLAGIINDCLLGDKLKRIRQLAGVREDPALLEATDIANRLKSLN
jgi:hypothetical protein